MAVAYVCVWNRLPLETPQAGCALRLHEYIQYIIGCLDIVSYNQYIVGYCSILGYDGTLYG